MVTEIQLIVIKWMIYVAFVIIIVALMFTYIPILLDNTVFGQTVTTSPTPTITVPQVQYAPIELKPAGQNDYLAMAMPLILSAGGIILAKFAKDTNDKVKKVETTAKENSNAIVDSKVVAQELARLLFEWNEQKANTLNNSPVTKLENLKEDVKKAVDTATNA